jgi:hypothetical protein
LSEVGSFCEVMAIWPGTLRARDLMLNAVDVVEKERRERCLQDRHSASMLEELD